MPTRATSMAVAVGSMMRIFSRKPKRFYGSAIRRVPGRRDSPSMKISNSPSGQNRQRGIQQSRLQAKPMFADSGGAAVDGETVGHVAQHNALAKFADYFRLCNHGQDFLVQPVT